MLDGGVLEIITHFAGLMRIPLDADRTWHFDQGDGVERSAALDHSHDTPSRPDSPIPDDLASQPSGVPFLRPADVGHLRDWHAQLHPHPKLTPPPHTPLTPIPYGSIDPFGGMSGDGTAAPDAGPRWTGADQTVVDVHQANMLIAENTFGNAPTIDASEALAKLAAVASGAVASGLPHLGLNATDEVAAIKEWHGGAEGDPLATGRFTDGTFEATGGTPTAASLPDLPSDDALKVDNHVVLGGNVVANAAVIQDTSQAHLSTIVYGDLYHQDVISQVNAVRAYSSAELPADGSVAWTDKPALVHNIADFQSTDLGGSFSVSGGFSTAWNVKVVDGDFYDVKSVTQDNVLLNDNAYVGAPQLSHSVVVLGANGQENAYDFGHDAQTYDLLVVGGDYRSVIAISQLNVLLDDAHVRIGGGTGGSLETGGDQVTNHASVIDAATRGGSQALSPQIKSFADDLREHLGADSPANVAGVPSLGATVNVLWVTGDYYDLTLLRQTNILSNDSLASVDLSSATGPTHVLTGANTLSNSAVVLNAGSLGGPQYVGGHSYDDATLHQANIVTSGHDETSAAHPWSQGFAPELVAFLDTGDASHGPALSGSSTPIHVHHDVMAGVLA